MTNILQAIVITTTITNWQPVAEWHPLPSGQIEIVEHGFLQTNYALTVDGHVEFLSVTTTNRGPKVAERRVQMTNAEIQSIILSNPYGFYTNWPHGIMLTNLPITIPIWTNAPYFQPLGSLPVWTNGVIFPKWRGYPFGTTDLTTPYTLEIR